MGSELMTRRKNITAFQWLKKMKFKNRRTHSPKPVRTFLPSSLSMMLWIELLMDLAPRPQLQKSQETALLWSEKVKGSKFIGSVYP